jgi:hypothetical protein
VCGGGGCGFREARAGVGALNRGSGSSWVCGPKVERGGVEPDSVRVRVWRGGRKKGLTGGPRLSMQEREGGRGSARACGSGRVAIGPRAGEEGEKRRGRGGRGLGREGRKEKGKRKKKMGRPKKEKERENKCYSHAFEFEFEF